MSDFRNTRGSRIAPRLDGGPILAAPLAQLAAALGASIAAIASLAALVAWSAQARVADASVVHELHEGLIQPLVRASLGLSFLASTQIALIMASAAAIALILARRARPAIALLASVASTQAAVTVLKVWMSRPRPPAVDAATQASGFSFPSGHSATGAALYGTLALIVSGMVPRGLRVPVLAAGLLLSVLIAASRVYLGVHYPTDVIAGWLTGAVVSVAVGTAVLRPRSRRGG